MTNWNMPSSEQIQDAQSLYKRPARPQPAEPRLGLAVLAAGVVGFAAMMAWFGLIYGTGWEIGYAAWGIGVVIGFATLWGAGARGVMPGVIALLVATVAILGGEYLAVRTHLVKLLTQDAQAMHADRITAARFVCDARTEDEIRYAISMHNYVYDETVGPEDGPSIASVTPEQVANFHTDIRPISERYLDGDPSKEDVIDDYVDERMDGIGMPRILSAGMSLWTGLWLFLGVGSAWKIAAGDDKS